MGVLIVAGMIFLFNTLGSERVFIDPKAKRDVKKYIADESRKNEILDLMREYKEDYTLRRSIEKEMEARFEELYSYRARDLEDFQPVINVYMRTRIDYQDLYVEAMMQFKHMVTDQEWAQLLVNIDKSANKYLKKLDKVVTEYKNLNAEISTSLESAIKDKDLRMEATRIMDEVDAREMAILEKLRLFNYKDWEMLRDRKTKKEDYILAMNEYNGLWQDYFDLYLDAYERLSKVTTDDEWKVISKYTKKIF